VELPTPGRRERRSPAGDDCSGERRGGLAASTIRAVYVVCLYTTDWSTRDVLISSLWCGSGIIGRRAWFGLGHCPHAAESWTGNTIICQRMRSFSVEIYPKSERTSVGRFPGVRLWLRRKPFERRESPFQRHRNWEKPMTNQLKLVRCVALSHASGSCRSPAISKAAFVPSAGKCENKS
jgi:hypothetical protein